MSTTYKQTGELKTPVALTNTGAHLNHGNWLTYPIGSVPVSTGYTQVFVGDNEGSSTICSDGYVTYQAADGTYFVLRYNCTMSGKNDISMDIQNLSGPWTHGSVSATGGFDSTYSWEIVQKATFVDAPVFAEALLAAPKCSLVPRSKIWEYIDGRSCIYLRDCFAVEELPLRAKLWCAVNALFLTPMSKSVLLRDLAQLAVGELSAETRASLTEFDKFMAVNERLSKGDLLKTESDSLGIVLDGICGKSETDGNLRDRELIGIVRSLLNQDLCKGWKNAVSSYISYATGDELGKRQNSLIGLIGKRL
jgi:hypothetical protein